MNEANKKTPRTFQCRNGLWATFEDMAQELECSVDYLINDAMKQYARQRGYAKDLPSAAMSLAPQPPGMTPGPPSLGALPTRGPLPPPAHRVAPGSGSFPHPAPPAPPLPPPRASGHPPAPPPPTAPAAGVFPPGLMPPTNKRSTLTLHFEGHAYLVDKDRFVIGRGKTSSDLTIRDPNVSRQHAVVEFAGGNYYIVDMGSTNGIEFRGQRVQRKAIQNGDVFRICDHDLFCSLG